MEETRTHWKKNIDSRYISGEDLKAGLRGFTSEMIVTIDRNNDVETFDPNEQQKKQKTGLWLKKFPSGEDIYKPAILNTVNARFFISEFKSDIVEDWYGKPVILWAQPDKRFGHVARFKKYYPSATVKPDAAISALSATTNLAELGEAWAALSTEEKNLPTVIAKKDELKKSL